jgi:hypothetical protein
MWPVILIILPAYFQSLLYYLLLNVFKLILQLSTFHFCFFVKIQQRVKNQFRKNFDLHVFYLLVEDCYGLAGQFVFFIERVIHFFLSIDFNFDFNF